MKRTEFIKHLNKHNCYLYREGSKHSIFKNEINKYKTTVPRHKNLKKFTCIAM